MGIMSARSGAAVALGAGRVSAARTFPNLLVSALGLLAVVAGILGMHFLAAPVIASHSATSASHSASTANHAAHSAGHSASPADRAVPALLSAAGSDSHTADPVPAAAALPDDDPHHASACPDCGPGGCVAGLCMLFLVLVSITAVLGLKISRMLRGPGHRGPPAARPTVQAPPLPPSLVQLCISRT